MQGADAAQRLGGEGDVGGLRGHADHHREVQEVPVVRLLLARKAEPAAGDVGGGIVVRRIVDVRVVQGEHELHEEPRPGHRQEGQGDATHLDQPMVRLRQRELPGDRGDAGGGGEGG